MTVTRSNSSTSILRLSLQYIHVSYCSTVHTEQHWSSTSYVLTASHLGLSQLQNGTDSDRSKLNVIHICPTTISQVKRNDEAHIYQMPPVTFTSGETDVDDADDQSHTLPIINVYVFDKMSVMLFFQKRISL